MPSPPASVMVTFDNFQPENFSIVISWEVPEYGLVDEYRIEISTTTQTIYSTATSVVLDGEYNTPLEINISAINCAGSSAEVTEAINVGKTTNKTPYIFPFHHSQLAVLLPLHLPMAVLVSSTVPG